MDSQFAIPQGPFVFLGGSCDPTTWRTELAAPVLDAQNVPFFNPQNPNWSAEWEAEVERPAKKLASVRLFVIDTATRAIGSMIETAYYLGIEPDNTVVVVLGYITDGTEIQGQVCTGRECKDNNRGRDFINSCASLSGQPVYTTLEEGLKAVVEKMKRL